MISMNVSQNHTHPILKVIAGATLIAGTLDISDALTFYGLRGVPPTRLLQSISAAALFGRPAYNGGMRTAVLGLLIHFCIATTVATVYILASRTLPLYRHPFLYGTIYGIVVYCIMNYIVIPLGRTPPKVLIQPLAPLVNGVAALIFCIGIPIAFIASRYVAYSRSPA
jgi:uncharacterized membrane protein YagU involved in acid resistance